ncbi:protein C3orf33 homolog isoform 2-T2 [Aulostomus maculatus]
MPESYGERENEDAGRDRQERDQGHKSSRNVVSIISQFADDNLTVVRSTSTGLAVAGILVIARSIRLVTKFQHVSEIPARFIQNNVSLCGKVQSITEKGIEVEHVPIYLPLISPLFTKHKGVCTSPLLVNLAGVELTPEGRLWLQRNVTPAQTVWLKLISREDVVLHCLVSQSKGSIWRRDSINEQVLRLGLARTAPIAGAFPDSRLYWRLHKRLHRAEVKAERKGRGLWKEDSLWERVSKAVRNNRLLRLMSRLFRRT